MNYSVVTYDNYLEHHGILGQKWGVRRYQNPDGSLTAAGKKHATKDLNKADKELSYDRREYGENTRKANKIGNKIYKLSKKKQSERVINKIHKNEEKQKQYMNKANEARKRLDINQKKIDKVISGLEKSGATVKSSHTTRNAMRGKDYATWFLTAAGQIGLYSIGVGSFAIYSEKRVAGVKYKVK